MQCRADTPKKAKLLKAQGVCGACMALNRRQPRNRHAVAARGRNHQQEWKWQSNCAVREEESVNLARFLAGKQRNETRGAIFVK